MLVAFFAHGQEARAEHRRQRQRDEQRDQHAEGDDDGEGAEELADDAAHEDDRREDRDQRQGRRDDRENDLVGAVDRSSHRVGVEFLAVAEDVFEDDDGVIDDDADQQQQAEHGQRIERVAEEIDDRDGAHQRDRDGQRDDDRRPHRLQEQPDDQRGEQRAFDQVLLQRIDDFQDEHRVVGDDVQLHARRQLRAHLVLDLFLDLVDNGDGVGVGDLDDAEADGGFAVEAGELAVVGEAVHDFGDILEADRRAGFRSRSPFACRASMEWNSRSSLTRLSVFSPTTKPPAICTCSLAKASLMSCAVTPNAAMRAGSRFDADGPVATAAEAHFADAVDGFQALLDAR